MTEAAARDFEPVQPGASELSQKAAQSALAASESSQGAARSAVEKESFPAVAFLRSVRESATQAPEAPTGFYPNYESHGLSGTRVGGQGDAHDKGVLQESATRAPIIPEIIAFPTRSRLRERYRILQQWEGTVTEIGDESFVARLRDLTVLKHPEERAEFSVSEVHENDLPLLRVGSVFYWAVGRRHQANGQRLVTSELRFRRLPQWTQADLERLEEPSEIDELFDGP